MNHHKTQSITITLFKNTKVSGMVSTHLCVPEAHHGARDVLRYPRSTILGANNKTCAAVQRKKGQQITAASIWWAISVRGSELNDLHILFWFSLKVILGSRHLLLSPLCRQKNWGPTSHQQKDLGLFHGKVWVLHPTPAWEGECNVTHQEFCPLSPQGVPQSQ